MSKRLISVLLIITTLFCLSACETTEADSNATNSQSKTSLNASDTTQTETDNNQMSSGTGESKENNTTQAQTQTNQSTHTHSYSNATCTSPKKCSCGATSGTMLGHSYSDANCASPKTCTRCGTTAGTALGHQFSSASCTSPKICSRCGATDGSELGHNYSAANCNSPKTCTRCGQTSSSALGHNYVNNKCSRCGKVDPESLPVGLHQLHIIDGNSSFYKYDENSFQDTYGNTYTGVHIWGHRHSGIETVVYNLDQKYKTFNGSIVASPRLESCAYADYYIYVDDQLVYTYTEQEKTTGKIDFEIDVRNATKLSIRAGAYKKPSEVAVGYMGCACIVNAQLTK